MDLRKLKKLIDLVEESGIAELEITEGEEKVRISKSANPAQGSATPVVTMAQPQAPASVFQAGASSVPPQLAEAIPEGHVVKSPMVGTFYRSSAPGGSCFCRGRTDGQGRRYALHCRGDEALERNRVRQKRSDKGSSGGKRATGRVWRTVICNRLIWSRLSGLGKHVRKNSNSQSW